MRKNIYLMYGIAFLQGMVFYAPISTLYRQAHGVSFLQITLIESISLVLMLVLEIPWGVIADKIGYRKTMIICTSLFFVSKIIFWKANGFSGFLLERLLLSVVLAGMSGVDTSILYLSCEREEDSQKVFGICSSMGTAGLLVSSTVFAVFVQDDYEFAGFLTVVSYGISALLAFGLTEVKLLDVKQVQQESFGEILKKTLCNRKMLLFLVAVGLLSETFQTVTVFLNQLQYQRCGLRNSAIGYVYIAATVIGMCGVWSAAVTKKLGRGLSFVVFCAITVLCCLTLAVSHSATPSVIGILTLCVVNAVFQPFQAEIQHQQVQTVNRASALSINAMLIDCVGIGTNLVFGMMAQVNLAIAFSFGAAISIVSLLLFHAWHRTSLITE